MSVNCTTDLAVTTLEWLDSGHRVLLNTSTDSYLVLTGSHNTEYTCRATGPFGNQNKSVVLLQSSPSNSSAVYGATVAALLVLVAIATAVIVVVVLVVKKYVLHNYIHTVMY